MRTSTARYLVVWSLGLGAVGSGVWAVVNRAMAQHKADYAGMSFPDAQHHATNALIVTYGKDFVARMRYGTPNVVNTHLTNALTGTGQVRVFHLVGPRGAKYCVSIWSPGTNWSSLNNKRPGVLGIDVGSQYQITKGCRF